MKKILIVTDAWSPQVNGVVTVYKKVIEVLRAKGCEVALIEPSPFRTIAVPFYKEVRLSFFPKRKVRKMIEKEAPDYIHIATEGPLGLATRRVCLQKGYPFTTAYHTHFPEYLMMRRVLFPRILIYFAYMYMRWFHKAEDALMVATNSLKDELSKKGFSRMELWPLGVDTELFKYNEHSPAPEFKKPVYAYLGRIAAEKNIEEYLKMDVVGTKIVIGDGPARKEFEEKYGSEVKFVGYKKGQELVDWLSRTDVLVFPSRSDTFGLVIIEAMACGVPVAAHDVMGPRDIIEQGVDGYMDEDLKRAAEACLSISHDACRKKALEYSWDSSIEYFVKNLKAIR